MNLFLIQANYCLPVNYWSEKSCSEVKSSGIRMPHLDFKLKKKERKSLGCSMKFSHSTSDIRRLCPPRSKQTAICS